MYLLYITFPNKEEALNLAHLLVEEKIIACANVYDNVTSIYHLGDKTVEEPECTMIAKTKDALIDSAIYAIKKRHSYDTPCIVAIKADKADQEFLKWVESSTRPIEQK